MSDSTYTEHNASESDARSAREADVLRSRAFRRHLDALGLGSAADYRAFCRLHGLSTRLDKDWKQRCREIWIKKRGALTSRLARDRRERRHRRGALDAVFAGCVEPGVLVRPEHAALAEAYAAIEDADARAALRRLVLHVSGRSRLLSLERVVLAHGARPGNTFLGGLVALAHHGRSWRRPVEGWAPRTHNPRRQFRALARHLLARWPLPAFLDSVWFRGLDEESRVWQERFVRLGNGESVRALGLPARLTRRMAHLFLQAPPSLSVEEALRYAQVAAFGGDAADARTIAATRLGTSLDDDEFWCEVIRKLVTDAALQRDHYGPLVDFIARRREERPGFSIAGRPAPALLRQMGRWHRALADDRTAPRPALAWSPLVEREFRHEEILADGTLVVWSVRELLSSAELREEGGELRHCVASYSEACERGYASIWSLARETRRRRRKRVLTIEVLPIVRRVSQIRGRANRRPRPRELAVVERWARELGFSMPAS